MFYNIKSVHAFFKTACLISVCTFLPMSSGHAETMDGLLDMSIEDLMGIQVISAMRKPQSVSETASAIYVITQEDIKRSGATSLPEMLRLAPGLHVAQINGNKWAVTSRGFNDEFADKLLVMIDGRSVYTVLHGGVYWDAQDLMAEDIERIEIIRGPGGSLWGANAINGIINVITKSSMDTHGSLAVIGGGDHEKRFAGLRQGGGIGGSGDYRVYAKGFVRKNGEQFYTDPQIDPWQHLQGGFRTDWQLSDNDELTIQGDAYEGSEGLKTSLTSITVDPYNFPIADIVSLSGKNIVAHWTREFSPTSQLELRSYYDHTYREKDSLTEVRDTYDIDFQHSFNLYDIHQIVWGLGYRSSKDSSRGSYFSSLTPDSDTFNTASAVLQDEISLADDKVRLTIGSKFEENDYTGFESQPSIRLLWKGDDSYSVWSSVGKAVRIPSRGSRNLLHHFAVIPPGAMGPGSPATPITLQPNPDLKPVQVLTSEIGGRGTISPTLSFDVTAFSNQYKDLDGMEMVGFDFVQNNSLKGESHGAEVLLRWQPNGAWKLSTSYSWIKENITSNDPNVLAEENFSRSPAHQFKLQTSYKVSEQFEMDYSHYYVSSIPRTTYIIDAYHRSDLRLGWKFGEDLEVSLAGQNLFKSKHVEFSSATKPNYEVPRSAYAKVTWSF